MHLYQEQENANTSCNFVRYIQMLICALSSLLSVYNFRYDAGLSILIYAFLLMTSGSYTIVTVIDVLSRCFLHVSIPYRLWTMYSLTASPMFFACTIVYASMLDVYGDAWAPILLVFFTLGGVAFLWDGVCILFFRKYRVNPAFQENIEFDNFESGDHEKQSPESTERQTYLGLMHAAEPISSLSSPSTSPHKSQVQVHGQDPTRPKKRKTSISYGGTFHMSKDAVPLPSPKIGSESKLSMISERSEQPGFSKLVQMVQDERMLFPNSPCIEEQ